MRRTALVVSVVAAVAGFSGLLTAYTFNAVVDRPSEFDPLQPAGLFTLGLQTLAYPIFVGVLLLGVGAAVSLLFRIAPWPRRKWHAAWRGVLARSGLQEQEYAGALAQVAVFIGFLAVALAVPTFSDIAYAVTGTISSSDLDLFAPLSLEYDARVRRIQFRAALATLLVLVMIGWLSVRRVRLTRGGSVAPWVGIAGCALIGILLALSQAPYKLMVHNQMPVVVIEGDRCYRLGAHASDIRVFCPSWMPPRVRTRFLRHAEKAVKRRPPRGEPVW
jgi:hypothetical protein